MTSQGNGPARGASDKARLLADWREAAAREIAALEATNAAPSDQDAEQAWDAALTRVRALAREAWAGPVSGPANLRLRAEIAQHCLWVEDPRRFEAVLNGQPDENRMSLGPFDERAVAELVKAVLWTAGAGGAIAAGREPEEGATAEPEPAGAAAGSEGRTARELAGDLEDLVGRARDGMTALYALWDSGCGHLEFPDEKLAASLKFCIEGVDALLEQAEQQTVAVIKARRPPG
ncbi:MAG TPA: hypothetical protein VGF29_01510 [Hyphomicrobiaceae bacterium]|jgi:hypothetical protein